MSRTMPVMGLLAGLILMVGLLFGDWSVLLSINSAIWILLLTGAMIMQVELSRNERFSFEDVFFIVLLFILTPAQALVVLIIALLLSTPALGKWGWTSQVYTGCIHLSLIAFVSLIGSQTIQGDPIIWAPIIMLLSILMNIVTYVPLTFLSDNRWEKPKVFWGPLLPLTVGLQLPLATFGAYMAHDFPSTTGFMLTIPLLALVFLGRNIEENIRLRSQAKGRAESLRITAHELRTPLTTISGWAQTLKDQRDKLDIPTQNIALDQIYNQSERLEGLIDNLLTAAQLDSGKTTTYKTDFALQPLIYAACESAGTAAVYTTQDSLWVRGDQDHLQRILINYLANAEKYGAGAIVVRSYISPEHKDRVAIEVEDHGSGIGEEFEKKLFQAFQREGKIAASGTGLGLSISAGLAEQNDGRAYYRRARHGGAIFGVEFPKAQAPQEVSAPESRNLAQKSTN